MSKSTSHTHCGPGRWIWSSLLVMTLLGPCGACWGLTKGLYESSGNTPGPRPYPSQVLTTPTNTLGFQELWHFDLDGLEEGRERLLIADVDGDGAEGRHDPAHRRRPLLPGPQPRQPRAGGTLGL